MPTLVDMVLLATIVVLVILLVHQLMSKDNFEVNTSYGGISPTPSLTTVNDFKKYDLLGVRPVTLARRCDQYNHNPWCAPYDTDAKVY